MRKVNGIKSVDFKVIGVGHGVVNYNGPVDVMGDNGKIVNNHTMPKLRGYSNLSGKVKEETGFKHRKNAYDINFSENPLYISQNCIKHHLFKDQEYDADFVENNPESLIKLLVSETGLLRGYVFPQNQSKRKSPLFMEDFIEQAHRGNYEQMSRSGSKEKKENKRGEEKSNTLFSKTTFGDTEYIGYGSINIEDLQFISLDKKFDNAAINKIKESDGDVIAQSLTSFLNQIKQDKKLRPKATYHQNYVRSGTIFDQGQAGILLNDHAVDILVDEMLDRIFELDFQQGDGWYTTTDMVVDYNDKKTMRIKRDESVINDKKSSKYAVYYEAK